MIAGEIEYDGQVDLVTGWNLVGAVYDQFGENIDIVPEDVFPNDSHEHTIWHWKDSGF